MAASQEFLGAVVVGLIVLGLVFFFIGPQLFGWKIEKPEIGKKEETGTSSGPAPQLPQLAKKEILKIISKGQTTFSQAEIGCSVAQDVVNDRVQYGTKGARKYCFGTSCIAGSGTFSLKQQSVTKEQEKALNDFSCSACDPLLDETCISKNLAKQVISETPFCNSFISTVGGENLITGNAVCTANFNNDVDKCAEICPGGDILQKWESDATSVDTVDDKRNLKENEKLLDDKTYTYVLQWDLFKKAYQLSFLRVPEKIDAGKFETTEDITNFVSANFLQSTRTFTGGKFLSDPRRVADFTFTVGNDVYITDFSETLKKNLLVDNILYSDCTGEECLQSEIVQGYVTGPFESYTTLTLRSNVGEDGKLEPGKIYRAALMNWKVSQTPSLPPRISIYEIDYTVSVFEVRN